MISENTKYDETWLRVNFSMQYETRQKFQTAKIHFCCPKIAAAKWDLPHKKWPKKVEHT